MSLKIKVYRHGLHRGEEKLVYGNIAAGMVNFSGCHLKCSFCYTPETSVRREGQEMNPLDFYSLLLNLKSSGARNINLISPTHLWKQIEAPLRSFRENAPLPLVLKTSGYESPHLLSRMGELADVFVPDFKVMSEETAESVNLPSDYGQVASQALSVLLKSHKPKWNAEGQMTRGILVRHLLMPGRQEDSLRVLQELKNINFRGALNIMTHFLDPLQGRLVSASPQALRQILREAAGGHFKILVNGTVSEVIHA